MESLPPDFADFLKLLNAREVKYLVVGGYAVAYHGFVRATGDLDIYVELSAANAAKLVEVFEAFGFPAGETSAELFTEHGNIVRIGVPPLRLEILNQISGVDFAECHASRITEEIGDVRIHLIDLPHLLRNKKAAGRPKDLADVHELTSEPLK